MSSWIVPRALEDAVYAAAREVIGDAPLATPALRAAIVDRSERYTSDREHLARPANATADLAARAAFFTIADAIKIAIPLAELRNRDALPSRAGGQASAGSLGAHRDDDAGRPAAQRDAGADPREALRVVDLGAGCGALSLGLAATLPGPFVITAIDHDAKALSIAARALAAFAGPRATVATNTADVTRAEIPPADLVVIGTLLNELAPDARLALVTRALRAIGEDGAVIIIEPALRETARALEELRDALLGKALAHVFAPCTRRGAPCPMLANEHDWCHEDRAVELPPRTAELARLTHLRDGTLKFSYLVLRRDPRALVDAADAWRVVSSPHAEKGKLELYGCSDAGRVSIRRLRRHRAGGNRELEAARRGDVLVVGAEPGSDRVEVTSETRVERIEPARER